MTLPLPFPADRKPLIGVIHLPALPGSPGWTAAGQPPLGALLDEALRDAEVYAEAGYDGLFVENFGDAPFFKLAPAETTALITRCTREVIARVGLPTGVNVLRNDARAALGAAVAAEAGFIRVNVHTGAAATDQGIIEGRAAETLRLRDQLGAGPTGPHPVALLADVHVKHARPLDSDDIGQAAADAAKRGRADGLIVSGPGTGAAPDAALLERVRRADPGVPSFIGSGLTADLCATLVPWLDGAIVASATRKDGRAGQPVELDRARALAEAFRAAGS